MMRVADMSVAQLEAEMERIMPLIQQREREFHRHWGSLTLTDHERQAYRAPYRLRIDLVMAYYYELTHERQHKLKGKLRWKKWCREYRKRLH